MTEHDLQRRNLVPPSGALGTEAVEELLAAFLSGKSETTLRAYRQDLGDFSTFVGVHDANQAVRKLISGTPGEANHLVLTYRSHCMKRGLAASTVNRRLSALRSLVGVANMIGVIAWRISVPNLKTEVYRDTRGPGVKGVGMMLKIIRSRRDTKGIRDYCILRLLFDLALRRNEVVVLDLEDVDLEGGTILVLGKGKSAKKAFTLPAPTVLALRQWVEVRGIDPGCLFHNVDRAGKGRRLTGHSVNNIVAKIGESIGLKVRAHGVRHASITTALDLSRGDIRAVASFSRHKDVRVVQLYDDSLADHAGRIAQLVAESV